MVDQSIFSRREGLVGGRGCNDEVLIDDTSKASTDKGPDPVDPVVGEVPGHEGGSERARGVHGSSVKGSREQDVGRHNETDGQGCDDPHVPLGPRVHCGCVHRIH